MKAKQGERLYLEVTCDLPVLRNYMLEFGPFVPLCVVHRLVRRSKTRVRQLIANGKLRVFAVAGMRMTPLADVVKQWPEGDNGQN